MLTQKTIRKQIKKMEKRILEARTAVCEEMGRPLGNTDPGDARLKPLYAERRLLKDLLRVSKTARRAGRIKSPPDMRLLRGQITKTVSYIYDESDNRRLDEFYASQTWKLVRYEALRRHGARCQCCGADGRSNNGIHVDHIKPLRVFWDLRLDLNNLQVLCGLCNEGKGARHADDWRPKV